MSFLSATANLAALLLISITSRAQPVTPSSGAPAVRLQLSPYTLHYTHNEAHRAVRMLGFERENTSQQLDGVTFFSNSFGQPTLYVYPWGGSYPRFAGIPELTLKWTAGLLYGYKEPYQNKVPLNYRGLSPAVIPALSYQVNSQFSAQVNVLGTAGLMFQLNFHQ